MQRQKRRPGREDCGKINVKTLTVTFRITAIYLRKTCSGNKTCLLSAIWLYFHRYVLFQIITELQQQPTVLSHHRLCAPRVVQNIQLSLTIQNTLVNIGWFTKQLFSIARALWFDKHVQDMIITIESKRLLSYLRSTTLQSSSIHIMLPVLAWVFAVVCCLRERKQYRCLKTEY